MIEQAETLLKQVKERIASCTASADFASVGHLAELALAIQSKLEEARRLSASLDVIRRQFNEICSGDLDRTSLPPLSRPQDNTPAVDESERSDQAPMTIKVWWHRLSAAPEPEVIARSSVAATMRSFLERALTVMGDGEFERLASVRTGRGPLVSKHPSADYVNKVTGAIYTHHRLGNSAWHVITHSSTREKVDHLRQALQVFGLRDATISIADGVVSAAPPLELKDCDDGRI